MIKPIRYSQQNIDYDDIEAVEDVLHYGSMLTQGPVLEKFESALAEYVGAKYCVAVNSGTAALHLAYLAASLYRCNLARKSRILTSPLSFVATANAALMAHQDLEFCDVDSVTGNVEAWVRSNGDDVVVPVHFAGRAAAIPERSNILSDWRTVVEDAAHALGAMDFDGCSRVGSCAHSLATCFSFHPVKPITTGEGGAITTNDEGFAQECREMRSHGRDGAGLMQRLGWNYRMPEMSAALGLSQLKKCEEMRVARLRLAVRYAELLKDERVALPPAKHGDAWHLFTVRIKNGRRDEVKSKLNAAGIGAQVHYLPIHEQPYYSSKYGYHPEDFPNAHAWGQEELSLPLHAGMTEKDVERVCEALRGALNG